MKNILFRCLGIIISAYTALFCFSLAFINFQDNNLFLCFLVSLSTSVWIWFSWGFVTGKSVFLKTYAKKT